LIVVLIATCNRPELLRQLIGNLDKQTLSPDIIIISDSSDSNKKIKASEFKNLKSQVIYTQSKIKSAAIQRNFALELVPRETKFIVILDDDVIPQTDYIDRIIKNFGNQTIVGVSGIAVNRNSQAKNKLSKVAQKLFLLDSQKEGSITLGGINVPFSKTQNFEQRQIQADWLIGCSAWRYSAIKKLRFTNFLGQSLFEDVIFSVNASRIGKLIVDTSIQLDHIQSPTGRSNSIEFYRMWVFNRYLLVRNLNKNPMRYFAFHWANFGKFLQIITEIVCFKKNSFDMLRGFYNGYFEILKMILKK
jgi:GT2 family glycosyltransferase